VTREEKLESTKMSAGKAREFPQPDPQVENMIITRHWNAKQPRKPLGEVTCMKLRVFKSFAASQQK
jgi:hypothetical protein